MSAHIDTDTERSLHWLVRYPQLHDRDWLARQYLTRRRSMASIARELGCSNGAVIAAVRRCGLNREIPEPEPEPRDWLTHYRCPHCRGTGRLER